MVVKDGGYRGVRKWYDHEEEFFIIICNLTPPSPYIVGDAVYTVPSWNDYTYNGAGIKNITVNNYYWESFDYGAAAVKSVYCPNITLSIIPDQD